MESNFIKERIVVRQDIIKKNLEASKEGATSLLQAAKDSPSDRVVAVEELVNDKLKKDLGDIAKREDEISSVVADYLKIKSALQIFKLNSKDVRVQTNIGCDFYAQCHIPDASKIYICVGQDYFLHMELDEAIEMLDFKDKQLRGELDKLQEKASRVKAYIKIALETLGRLYDMDRHKLLPNDDDDDILGSG